MKKYLLPRLGKFYKANMHTHTTVSDGKLTPEEAKEAFKAHGYSIVAFTDHEVMIPHNELRDESFLPITSYELSISNGPWNPYAKCYHMNVYSKDPDASVTKTFFKRAVWGNARNYITSEMEAVNCPDRVYTKEYVQWVIDTENEAGNLVSYNHPVWSFQNYTDYSGIRGFWGVEWANTGCILTAYTDTVQPITDLLAEGERMVYPLATDDCHAYSDYFGGWIQVKAKSLDYDTVFEALRRGDFYSSTGPAIKALYLEDGKVTVKTSAAKDIHLITDQRWTGTRHAKDKLLTEATFDISKLIENAKSAPEGHNVWFRLEVIDKYGKKALTRAYFLDELGIK